jgi:hypothetical protein
MPFLNHPISRTNFLPEHQVAAPSFESDPLFKAGNHFTLSADREKVR